MGTGESFLKGQFEVTLENLAAHHGPGCRINYSITVAFAKLQLSSD